MLVPLLFLHVPCEDSSRLYVSVQRWMWVSVLRAKVKPVAGVVEVGRIRVTDQRAPREPAGELVAEGPWVSSRARIASKTRARCSRLFACLLACSPVCFACLSTFVLRSSLPVSLPPPGSILGVLSFSESPLCPSPFVIVQLPSCPLAAALSLAYRAYTRALLRPPSSFALRFLLHSAVLSPSPPFPVPPRTPFSTGSVPTLVVLAVAARTGGSPLPAIRRLAEAYLPRLPSTRYRVRGTRYPVPGIRSDHRGEHTAGRGATPP